MGKLFSKIAHLFITVEHDAILVCHSLIVLAHTLFTGTEVQVAIDSIAKAGLNYANSKFEAAQTHSFVSNELMLIPGMTLPRANLVTSTFLSLAEHKVDGLLEKVREHFTSDNSSVPSLQNTDNHSG